MKCIVVNSVWSVNHGLLLSCQRDRLAQYIMLLLISAVFPEEKSSQFCFQNFFCTKKGLIRFVVIGNYVRLFILHNDLKRQARFQFLWFTPFGNLIFLQKKTRSGNTRQKTTFPLLGRIESARMFYVSEACLWNQSFLSTETSGNWKSCVQQQQDYKENYWHAKRFLDSS